MNRSLIVAAVSLFSVPAFGWETRTDFRGLQIYSASDAQISAVIVCDPDGAFIPPENHINVQVRGQPLVGPYEIRTSANAHSGSMQSGAASTRDPDWTGLIRVLRSGSQIKLTTQGETFLFNAGSTFPVSCGAETG